MSKEVYYVKSLEEDFVSKTIRGKKKVDFQSIENMIKTKTIKLNTKSFEKARRLSCTVLHKNYLKTYRAHGIIFQTKNKPNHIYPFDMVLLSNVEKIIVQYYRIKENLHQYYGHSLISGYQKFVFKDFSKMIKRFSSPKVAWKEVNKFRVNAGHKSLSKQKYRLVEYNEVVFQKQVRIKPIAIFGYKKEAREIAKKFNLPHFISTKKFYESLKK